MIFKFHTHTGYNTDDASLYDALDTIMDLEANTITTTHTYEGWGSNEGTFKRIPEVTTSVIIPFEDEVEIIKLLSPFFDINQKYPTKKEFSIYSKKQYYFLFSKLHKAVDLAGNSNLHQKNYLSHCFVFQSINKMIEIRIEYSYTHKYFKVILCDFTGE